MVRKVHVVGGRRTVSACVNRRSQDYFFLSGGKGEGVGLQWRPGRMHLSPPFRVSKEVTFLLATCKLVIDHVKNCFDHGRGRMASHQ